jgi:nicotinate-nucleotide pyrophosphorylase (carboxylating)
MSYIKLCLKEDIGQRDITNEFIIPKDKIIKACLLARENCVISGLHVAGSVFLTQDKKIKFRPLVKDGQRVKKGKILAKIEGRARSILTAERVALNFLTLLSGIATKTRAYADEVKPHKVKILDTRKTIPGLRMLEKYAVRMGGGFNHRMSLDEMIMVKDNHLKVIGGYKRLLGVTRAYYRLLKVTEAYQMELEVENLKEFKEALKLKPDIILLDNMSLADMKKAVKILKKQSAERRALLEASGGVTLNNVRKIAATGVDMISIGDLTHSLKSVDISLEVL